MMVRRILVMAVTTALAVALSGGPASAQDRLRPDRVGDGAPHADITSVRARNGDSSIVVSVRFATVRQGHTMAAIGLSAARIHGYYAIESTPVSGGRYRSTIVREDPPQDVFSERVDCPGLRVRWVRGEDGRMQVVVPWSCLDASPGRVKVSAGAIDKQGPKGALGVLRSVRRGDVPDGATVDGDTLFDYLDRSFAVRRD